MAKCGCKIIEKFELTARKPLGIVYYKAMLVTRKYVKINKKGAFFNEICVKKSRQKMPVSLENSGKCLRGVEVVLPVKQGLLIGFIEKIDILSMIYIRHKEITSL
ncbi:hypothetical protein [Acetivibrio straminisolvens]|jgi:hypothetical protein|uniref:Uncharacterized protein n=1 Tax=Acetivibrio straminisolvens JCM 21531 TaxID=1294263 RepID=W4VA97_9FIRM|nr:hypothetical protein [Acetivibrio straminisolvens]GAE89669.1 hypothetical protein JCM21531_3217 [Acetivibrio straminisolvens JCM 21531]